MEQLSGIELLDSTSGFRAYSREAALRLNVFSKFTYTLETLIQAGKKNLAVAHVPVGVNEKLRESRLFPNLWLYLKRSASTMVRIYAMYEPLKAFFYVGALLGGAGAILLLRFLYYFLTSAGPVGKLQSLLTGASLLAMGLLLGLIGVVSDLIAVMAQALDQDTTKALTLTAQWQFYLESRRQLELTRKDVEKFVEMMKNSDKA